MLLNSEDTVLLIIDIQEKLLNAVYNKEQLERKAGILAKTAAILGMPVFVTEQYPKGLGNTVQSLNECFDKNNTAIFEKTDFNALKIEELEKALQLGARNNIIVMGIETHICVHQTVDGLLDTGFKVTVASDASGSRCETEHLCGLNVMAENGADIKSVEMIVFELLKGSKHPNFKEIQHLIK